MRISDWSSDVCSSYLRLLLRSRETDRGTRRIAAQRTGGCGENPLSRSTRLENPAILGQRRAARDRSSDRRDLECNRETGPSPQTLPRPERGLSEELPPGARGAISRWEEHIVGERGGGTVRT